MGKRQGIMLCYPFEEKRLAKWKPPYVVQPKLDGERCRAVPIIDGKYKLLSSEANEFVSVPHVNKALEDSGLWPKELDGELYLHGLTFEEIFSIVSRTVNIHHNSADMQYHIFDSIDTFGTSLSDPQFLRLPYHDVRELKSKILIPVSSQLAESFEDVMREYDLIIEQGYEGMIIRHWEAAYIRRRSIYMMKFKPKKDDYYMIKGFHEEISKDGKPKGRLGAIVCTSDTGHDFAVGSGLTDELRENLWDTRYTLKGRLLHVQYQHITPGKGVPRFPVFLEILEGEPKEVGLK